MTLREHNRPMQNPNNLRVYGRSFDLAESVYRETRDFPLEERYGLTAQMRRAAVSFGSCIAEGCGRDGDRELARFVHMSMGSASELEFQTALSVRLGFATRLRMSGLLEVIEDVKRMSSRLIVSLNESAQPEPRPRPRRR